MERPERYWCRPAAAQEYESRRFDSLQGRLYRRLEEGAVDRALRGLPPGSRVLDAACGTGRITALLRRRGFRATACDISRAMMNVARRQLASLGYEVPLVETDVGHLPYQSQSFEAVTCVGLLMHLDADARVRVLRELARVSRDRLVVQYGRPGTFLWVKARLTGRMPGNVQYPLSEEEMRIDLARSGLTERARFWILRPFSSSVVVLLTQSPRSPDPLEATRGLAGSTQNGRPR
jgi:SAM-dependent methyltransferase